jgi:hypothetical protein
MLWQQFVVDPVQLNSYFLLYIVNEIILASAFAFVWGAKIAELIVCAAVAYSVFPQEVECLCPPPPLMCRLLFEGLILTDGY